MLKDKMFTLTSVSFEIATADHLIIVKVMMSVIIKSNVPSLPHFVDDRAICQMIIRKDAHPYISLSSKYVSGVVTGPRAK